MHNGGVFLRCTRRVKDGKEHRYWSIVENRRGVSQRVVQRQVLYLGEINDSQKAAWCRCIEVFDEPGGQWHQVMLFSEDREAPDLAQEAVHVRLYELKVLRPRQWGACWLSSVLWEQLRLDDFWRGRLGVSREGTDWLDILKTLVSYRLISPGSEWRLHREWYLRSGMADLLGRQGEAIELQSLYRCQDKLLAHKQDLFSYLQKRWQDLFQAEFEVLLYDLTSTYFECDPPARGKRRFGYSRDKRPDCVQVIIALVVTPDGLPLAYEVMQGNTSEKTTLKAFLKKIEEQYGRAQRIWVMDRGIPTEEQLREMREVDPPVAYLVGTPRGRLSKLEKPFLELPWAKVKESVEVKLLAQEGELYILARSQGRWQKERAMRRRRLKSLWKRLQELQGQQLERDQLLLKLGAAKAEAGPRLWLGGSAGAKAGTAGQRGNVHLSLAQGQTPASPAPGGPLSAALQSARRRPGPAVATLRAAHRDRSSLSRPEKRSGDPAPLSPEGLAHRSAHLRILLGLLFVHHLGAALADSGAGTDSSSGAGENVRDPNGGCVGAHDRWAAADSPPIHPTGEGSPNAAPPVAPTVAVPTIPENSLPAGGNRRIRRGNCSEDLLKPRT